MKRIVSILLILSLLFSMSIYVSAESSNTYNALIGKTLCIVNNEDEEQTISVTSETVINYVSYNSDMVINGYYYNYSLSESQKIKISSNETLLIEVISNDAVLSLSTSSLKIEEIEQKALNCTNVLRKDATYELINNEESTVSFKVTNSCTADIAVYNNDMSLAGYYSNKTFSTNKMISIPAGGTYILTKKDDVETRICYPSSFNISFEEMEQPALNYTSTLLKDKTYKIVNNENTTVNFSSSSVFKTDTAFYDSKGALQGFYSNKQIGHNSPIASTYMTNHTIPAGGTYILTKKDDVEARICYPSSFNISFEEMEQPALNYTSTLLKDKTYRIINNENVDLKFGVNNDFTADTVLYEKGDNIKSFYNQKTMQYQPPYISSSMINYTIPAGGTYVLTKKDDVEAKICWPNSSNISYEILETPALNYVSISEKNKTYKIKNNQKSEMSFGVTENCVIDKIIYNKNDSITEYGVDETLKKSANTNYKYTIPAGGTYTFTKKDDTQIDLFFPNDADMSFEMIEDLGLNCTKLEEGQTYIVKNNNYKSRKFKLTKSIIANACFYDKNGSIINMIDNKSLDKLYSVKSKGEVIITPLESNECILYFAEEFGLTIEKVESSVKSAINTIDIQPGETYHIINNLNVAYTVQSNADKEGLFNYITCDCNNKYSDINSGKTDINIPYNGSVYIENTSSSNISISIPYKYFEKYINVIKMNLNIDEIISLDGYKSIDVDITKVGASETDDHVESTDDLNNYYVILKDIDTKEIISGTVVNSNNIYIHNSYLSNDFLLELVNKNGNTETIVQKININDEKLTLKTYEKGYFYIKTSETNELSNMYALIIDENGDIIQTYQGINSIKSSFLDEAKYTVMVFRTNDTSWERNNLSEYNNIGMIEGKDYVLLDLTISNNNILKEIIDLPIVDCLKYYDVANTKLKKTGNGNQYGFYEYSLEFSLLESVDDFKIQISNSNNCSLDSNSILLDGNKYNDFVLHNTLNLKINMHQNKGILTFYVKPSDANKFKISVNFLFENNDVSYDFFVDEISDSINELTINVQEVLNTNVVLLKGIAPKNQTINLYCDGLLIEKVTANKKGIWEKQLILELTENQSYDFYVDYFDSNNEEIISETKTAFYSPNTPTIKSVILKHGSKKYNITNGFVYKDVPKVIQIPNTMYTYIITLTNNEYVESVYLRNSNDESCKAIFDKTTQAWIASNSNINLSAVTIDVNYNEAYYNFITKSSQVNDTLSYTLNSRKFSNNSNQKDVYDNDIETYKQDLFEAVKTYLKNDNSLSMWIENNEDSAIEIYENICNKSYDKNVDSKDTLLIAINEVYFDSFATNLNINNIDDITYDNNYYFVKLSANKEENDNANSSAMTYIYSFGEYTENNNPIFYISENRIGYLSERVLLVGAAAGQPARNHKFVYQSQTRDNNNSLISISSTTLSQETKPLSQETNTTAPENYSFTPQKIFEGIKAIADDIAYGIQGNYNAIEASGIKDEVIKETFERACDELEIKKPIDLKWDFLNKLLYFSSIKESLEVVNKWYSIAKGDNKTAAGLDTYSFNNWETYATAIKKAYKEKFKDAANNMWGILGAYDVGATMFEYSTDLFNCFLKWTDGLFKKYMTSDSKYTCNISGANDPSGYVYEATLKNKLEDVKCTIYFKNSNDEWIEWDATEYEQINPFYTNTEGYYEWFVPQGLWKVKYEKEGYITAWSEEMEVLPVWTNVNIGLISQEAPKINWIKCHSNYIEVKFSKYMKIDSLNSNNIEIILNGTNIEFNVNYCEFEESDFGKITDTIKIYPKNISICDYSEELELCIKSNVSSYANIKMAQDYRQKCTLDANILGIDFKCDDNLYYGNDYIINLKLKTDIAIDSLKLKVCSKNNNVDINEQIEFIDNEGILKISPKDYGEDTITIFDEYSSFSQDIQINIVPNPKTIIRGDGNNDGVVDLKDLLVLRQYLVKIKTYINIENADINADTFIDMKDVLELKKYIAKINV